MCSFTRYETRSCLSYVPTISQTVPQYLPKEITDIIISFLHPDSDWALPPNYYKPLCNCALVCRDWLPASRHHLLMDVWLDSDRQYNLFIYNVVRSPTVSLWLPSVRRIVLAFSRYMKAADGHMHITSRVFMHQLAGRFPNLEELDLRYQDWDTRECSIPPRMFILLSAFASVRTLLLEDVRFPSSGAMRCTITALPSLTDLGMDNVTWPVSRGNRPLRGTRKSQFLRRVRWLRLLDLDLPLEEEMLEWLSVTSLGTSLVDLHIGSTTLANGSELWEFVGPSVTLLVTNFWAERGEFPGDSTFH